MEGSTALGSSPQRNFGRSVQTDFIRHSLTYDGRTVPTLHRFVVPRPTSELPDGLDADLTLPESIPPDIVEDIDNVWQQA